MNLETSSPPAGAGLRDLPVEVRLVLRALASLPAPSDVAALSRRLDQPALRVLERLQMARDGGVDVRVGGAGTVELPTAWRRALTEDVVPGLLEAWQASDGLPRVASTTGPDSEERAFRRTPPRTGRTHTRGHEDAYRETLRNALDALARRDPETAEVAGHAVEASRQGLPGVALARGRAALSRLAGKSADDDARRARVALLCEMAEVRWHTAGPWPDFTLGGAFTMMREAQRLLGPQDEVELWSRVALLEGEIAADCGQDHSIAPASALLRQVEERLEARGSTVAAARLRRLRAVLAMVAGAVVDAAGLAAGCRPVFEAAMRSDPSVQRDLADTEHLLARLPLHTFVEPQQAEEVYKQAKVHAATAEAEYLRMADHRKLAHVWDTLARLHLRTDDTDDASEALQGALEAAETAGDVVALARSWGALAEIEAAAGRSDEALGWLVASITYNGAKACVSGLAANRRFLEALALDPAVRARPSYAEAEQRLREVERVVGQACCGES